MSELVISSCPFCRSHSTYVERFEDRNGDSVLAVCCHGCDATGPQFDYDSDEEDAIGAWNYQGVL